MDEDENTLDDVQEDVVDLPDELEDDSNSEGAGEPAGDVATPQESQPQSREENAAFAAMRRRSEQLEQEIQQRDELLQSFFHSNNPMLEARAYLEGRTPEELQEEYAQQKEMAQKDRELAELRAYRAQSTFDQDLHAIKTAYPDLQAQSIEELGDRFVQIMAASQLDPVTAYEIIRAQEERNRITPPPEVGKVNRNSTANKEYFTAEEVKAMSQEEVHKNWEKIEQSRKRWK